MGVSTTTMTMLQSILVIRGVFVAIPFVTTRLVSKFGDFVVRRDCCCFLEDDWHVPVLFHKTKARKECQQVRVEWVPDVPTGKRYKHTTIEERRRENKRLVRIYHKTTTKRTNDKFKTINCKNKMSKHKTQTNFI